MNNRIFLQRNNLSEISNKYNLFSEIIFENLRNIIIYCLRIPRAEGTASDFRESEEEQVS